MTVGAPRRLVLLDTSIASTNLGDQIIMEAVREHLPAALRAAFRCTVATHEWMGAKSRTLVQRADWAVAGGTSLLSSRMMRSSWKLLPWDALAGLDVVLMGAGWRAYQGAADQYSRWLLRGVLSRRRTHAVRDSYSESRLRALGFERVLNTACPTLWALSPERMERIPREPGRCVVTTVNTYLPNPARDRPILAALVRHYETVYLWPQTDADLAYAQELEPRLRPIEPTLTAYDALLSEEQSLDYVGLRLHGGIRALQHGRRTVIIEIDNRASTMAADFNLPTVAQAELNQLQAKITTPFETQLDLPWTTIEEWKCRLERKQ